MRCFTSRFALDLVRNAWDFSSKTPTFSTILHSNRCGTLLNETANPRMWFNVYDTMTNTTGYRDRISANLQL